MATAFTESVTRRANSAIRPLPREYRPTEVMPCSLPSTNSGAPWAAVSIMDVVVSRVPKRSTQPISRVPGKSGKSGGRKASDTRALTTMLAKEPQARLMAPRPHHAQSTPTTAPASVAEKRITVRASKRMVRISQA